jgi:hypothetical protein
MAHDLACGWGCLHSVHTCYMQQQLHRVHTQRTQVLVSRRAEAPLVFAGG